MSEYFYGFAGPSHVFLPEFPPPEEILEAARPSKRARPDEYINGNSVVSQDETNGHRVSAPQIKDKGKKKLGRPQKGCEECKR